MFHRPKKRNQYLQKARLLRKYGFPVKYGLKGANKTGANRAAVAKRWNQVHKFIDSKKQSFTWQPATKKEQHELRKGLSKQQFTPKGFFHRIPKGAKANPRYTVREDGTVEFDAIGPKGGKIHEVIKEISPDLLTRDAHDAVLAVHPRRKKSAKVVLTVNGFDSSTTEEYDLEGLANYIALDLLPKFLDPNLDREYARLHGKRKRTVREFAETFHVKFITYKSPKHGKRKKRGNRNRRH